MDTMKDNAKALADFFSTVSEENRPFVEQLHETLLRRGCTVEIKDAKSGYVVSYIKDKKTLANYVFRKKGMLIRIYANHVGLYMEKLDELSEAMVQAIRKAPPCKRLLNPGDCNPRCATGYDFFLRGERQQKCRYNAFFFFLNAENNPAVARLLAYELDACAAGA